jgi:hypothetical protein
MTNALTLKNSDPQVTLVIEKILDGLPLREAVKHAGLTPQLFNYRLQSDREAAVAYSRAVEIKADMMADEVVHLADGDGDPAKVRNQMNARQWLASKLYAKRYGDRIDLNVTQTIDIGSTLAEARSRLLPVRDQHNVIDVESRAVTGLGEDRATDCESASRDASGAASGAAPDIFS